MTSGPLLPPECAPATVTSLPAQLAFELLPHVNMSADGVSEKLREGDGVPDLEKCTELERE